MSGLVAARQRRSVRHHAIDAHAFLNPSLHSGMHAGQHQGKAGHGPGAKDNQLAPVSAAGGRACGFGIGYVGRDHFGAPAFRRQRRAADFKHAKQVHDDVPPPELMASEMVWNWSFSNWTPRLNFICASASSKLSRSTLTLLPSGRSMSP